MVNTSSLVSYRDGDVNDTVTGPEVGLGSTLREAGSRSGRRGSLETTGVP
jgi:hypothetical protein